MWKDEEEPFDAYFKKLVKVCCDRGLTMRPLGKVGRNKFIWALNVPVGHGKKRLLVWANIHGDETEADLGVLRVLEETSDEILFRSNLTLLPI